MPAKIVISAPASVDRNFGVMDGGGVRDPSVLDHLASQVDEELDLDDEDFEGIAKTITKGQMRLRRDRARGTLSIECEYESSRGLEAKELDALLQATIEFWERYSENLALQDPDGNDVQVVLNPRRNDSEVVLTEREE